LGWYHSINEELQKADSNGETFNKPEKKIQSTIKHDELVCFSI